MPSKKESRSFSSEVKEELWSLMPEDPRELRAFLAGFGVFSGGLDAREDGPVAVTDSAAAARKVFTGVRKAFNINCTVAKSAGYLVIPPDPYVITALRKVIGSPAETEGCAGAFARGAFLAAGTVTDPEKYYRLEIVTPDEHAAGYLAELLGTFSLVPKTTKRGGETVVYLQDGTQVSDMLGVLGASKSLLALENIRIVKEMRGNINRRVNLETSNLRKAATASARQLRDIVFLEENGGLAQLPESLKETARLRKDNPDMSLAELGQLFDPPLGRSGVNHRLRQLHDYTERMRERKV